MGIYFFSAEEGYVTQPSFQGIDPYKFHIIEEKQFGEYYVLKVKYDLAPNFDGVKIIVIHNPTHKKLERLDPHFDEEDKTVIARFRPDEQGWENAIRLAKYLNKTNKGGR